MKIRININKVLTEESGKGIGSLGVINCPDGFEYSDERGMCIKTDSGGSLSGTCPEGTYLSNDYGCVDKETNLPIAPGSLERFRKDHVEAGLNNFLNSVGDNPENSVSGSDVTDLLNSVDVSVSGDEAQNLADFLNTVDPDSQAAADGIEALLNSVDGTDPDDEKVSIDSTTAAELEDKINTSGDTPTDSGREEPALPAGVEDDEDSTAVAGVEDDEDSTAVAGVEDDEDSTGETSWEQQRRASFIQYAKEATGEQDAKTAVKIIQRALVNAGFSVEEEGATYNWGLNRQLTENRRSSIKGKIRIIIEQAGSNPPGKSWDEEKDEQYMVDGIPGPRTRRAAYNFQTKLKEMNPNLDLGDSGPNADGRDGLVGLRTWPHLKKHSAAKTTASVGTPADTGGDDSIDAADGASTVASVDAEPGAAAADERPTATETGLGPVTPRLPPSGNEEIDSWIENTLNSGKLEKMSIGVGWLDKSMNISIRTPTGMLSQDETHNPVLHDALEIYKALDGLNMSDSGDEKVNKILEKYIDPVNSMVRSGKNIAQALYTVGGKYYFKAHALYYAYNGRLDFENDTDDGDLLKWLEDDGLESSAIALRGRLEGERQVAKYLLRAWKQSSQEQNRGKNFSKDFFGGMLNLAANKQRTKKDIERFDASEEDSGYLKSDSDRPGWQGMGKPNRRGAYGGMEPTGD